MVERHKPTNEVRAATHPASDDDYARLSAVVVEAITLYQRDIVIKVPYFIVFDEDFPKGICEKRDARYNWYRAKTYKLADYLHSKGFMPTDAKGTMKSMRTVNNLLGELDRMILKPDEEFLKNHKNVLDSENEMSDNA